jgi:hypothetical protein
MRFFWCAHLAKPTNKGGQTEEMDLLLGEPAAKA